MHSSSLEELPSEVSAAAVRFDVPDVTCAANVSGSTPRESEVVVRASWFDLVGSRSRCEEASESSFVA